MLALVQEVILITFLLKKINEKNIVGFAFEIIDQDNDFLFHAF